MYQICTNCVMDTTVSDINFDAAGVCNYCHQAQERLQSDVYFTDDGIDRLQPVLDKVKQDGKRKKYDCIIGLSGGVDSTYLAYLVKKKYGLRPLAVHFDNGWNSELSVANIEKIVRKLDIDYFNYVMDWETFRELQLAFFKSSIANLEIPTDHAITALLFQQAAKHNVKYILLGGNISTESIMPSVWMEDARDYKLLKSINRRFSPGNSLQSFPHLNLGKMGFYSLLRRIKVVPVLNYVNYVKEDAQEELISELGWRDYGGKHFESIFTRFFQAYILPEKYNIDKRKAHFSSLINAKQMSRAEALNALGKSSYHYPLYENDRRYVLKKLNLNESDFNKIMSELPKKSDDYPNNNWLFERSPKLLALVRRMVLISSSFNTNAKPPAVDVE